MSNGITLNERLVDVFDGVVKGTMTGSRDGGVGFVRKRSEGGVVWKEGHLAALSHPLTVLHTRSRVERTGLRVKLLERGVRGVNAVQNRGRGLLLGAPVLMWRRVWR